MKKKNSSISSSSHGSSISFHSISSDSIPTYSIHSSSHSMFDSPSASFDTPMDSPSQSKPSLFGDLKHNSFEDTTTDTSTYNTTPNFELL
uniref:Uncharacterized protein n=1 Tax=Meloidogyne enterolobii TaxID=390850 RepID=A0A6V7U7W7_MELEN|nr:unnamed protein product [Meloidogyne enterolobii]